MAMQTDSKSDEPLFFDDNLETRAQLLCQKFQQLKNTSKLAKVILVDEMPIMRPPAQNSREGTLNAAQTGATNNESGSNHNLANSGKGLDETANDAFGKNSKTQPFQNALMYYPEENHMASETYCRDFNARVMKHLMKSKMNKNQTFYQSKIMNNRDSFLKR